MNRNEMITEMLGDNIAEFVAYDLKKSYKSLAEDLIDIRDGNHRVPTWSYDDVEESNEIMDMMEAIKKVYSWYSTKEINV